MRLKLERPIAFFDLETTGTDVATDRIVEIAVLNSMQILLDAVENGDILSTL